MPDIVLEHSPVPLQVDPEPVPKRIGVIALATDHSVEPDFASVCDPAEIGIYVNRIAYDNPTTPENLRRTGPRLTEAAAQILPGEDLGVIAYACTSASIVLGDVAVMAHIQEGRPEAQAVTPANAAASAFETLGVEKISVMTPYNKEVTGAVADYFEAQGLGICNATYLDFLDDRQMARISRDSIIKAGIVAMAEDADALFISCTALRSMSCVDALEREIGKPVVTSNQALSWRAQRLAGVTRQVSGFGLLYEH